MSRFFTFSVLNFGSSDRGLVSETVEVDLRRFWCTNTTYLVTGNFFFFQLRNPFYSSFEDWGVTLIQVV